MKRYRIGLIISTGLFVVIAIFSSIVGVGWFQGFLILTALILLLIIFIGGIAGLGPKDFWWKYFKPFAALPIAWGLLHLGLALMFPDACKEIWHQHWKLLAVIEISALVFNTLVNKDTPFEERTSRRLLTATYVLVFIVTGIMISYRLFYGEAAATLDRTVHSALMKSRVEVTAENIEKLSKNHKVKPHLVELDELLKKSKKELLSEKELQRVKKLKAIVHKEYTLLDEQKVKWEKLWPFNNKPTKNQDEDQNNHLSGDFRLPKDGTLTSQDKNGLKARYPIGVIVGFEQLGLPGKIIIENQCPEHPTWSSDKAIFFSGRTRCSDIVRLRSAAGRELLVRVKILPSRRRS